MIAQNKTMNVDHTTELEIELICRRLKYSVTAFDILHWLDSFSTKEERRIALRVLRIVDYLDENDIVEGYKSCLEKIFKSFTNKQTIVMLHPIGEVGKSGTLMFYFINKALKIIDKKYKTLKIRFVSQKGQLKKQDYKFDTALILFDDFIGSGKTVGNYYKSFVKPQISVINNSPQVFLLAVAALENGVTYLESRYPETTIFTYIKYRRAFSKEGSPFGYRKDMTVARDLCYKYGKNLFKVYDDKKKIYVDYPLGFDNSQALLVFSYGTPNNSLPIIWSTANGWVPLFPRMWKEKLSAAKSFRKETSHWLSLVNSLNFSAISRFASGQKTVGQKQFGVFNKTDFQLFALVRLKRMKRAIPIICQLLGLRIDDYSLLISKGKKRGLLDAQANLTEEGIKVYNNVTKYVNAAKATFIKSSYGMNSVSYVPKSFRGKA